PALCSTARRERRVRLPFGSFVLVTTREDQSGGRILMRKLIMWNMVTLDGFFEGPKSWDIDWHEYVWGDELEQLSIEQSKSVGMLLSFWAEGIRCSNSVRRG